MVIKISALLGAAALLFACSSPKSAGSVADKFVDLYYVEYDQPRAMPLAEGVASLRLQSEMKLVGAARNGVAPGSLAAKVYWKRDSLKENGNTAQADYVLTIRPQGGGEIVRHTTLDLIRKPDGTWRVTRFNESTQQ